MENPEMIWVFSGAGGRFPGGAFTSLKAAESWIHKYGLTGVLSQMPLNKSVFDWAVENDLHNLSPELLDQKKNSPEFIGSFSTASQQHFHYENGDRE